MAKEKIIVALDVPSAVPAKELIAELREEVGAFKIGLQLFVAAGATFVREVVESGAKVFLDLKFHDIPNTVAKASIEAARLGVWMFNLHAVGGGEMMRQAIEEVNEICAKENLTVPKIIGVTVLTSANDDVLRETGIEKTAAEQVLSLAKLTAASGLDGVVASPHEIRLIRQEIADQNFLIVTPGIRDAIQTDFLKKTDDQKRIMSAAEAVRAGSNYLVIGRPITKAESPKTAVRNILADVENQLSNSAVQISNP